jgi:hypothetical protein
MGALKLRVAAVAVSMLALGLVGSARAGLIELYESNPDATTIALHWSWYEDSSAPVDHPEWVGFDLLRRSVSACETFSRVNAETFPRVPGQSFDGGYVDSPPLQTTLYEYQLVPVDADHHAVTFSGPECVGCYWTERTWASAPRHSAPVTRGVFTEDHGWALSLTPCPSTCFPSVYADQGLDELRPYAQSQTPVSLYGDVACGTVEGCVVLIDHFEAQVCDAAVAARRSSWGKLKLLYR